jgi:hypothetical protein
MSSDKTGGMLGLLEQGDDVKPYYVVGRRPLDIYNIGEALRKGSPSLVHEQFILNNGLGNFGFTTFGEFFEPPSDLAGYKPTSKYGLKRYDANLLEQARQNWHAMHDKVDDVADEMELWDEDMPNIHREYSFLGNNCQDYVRWLNNEYDRLAKVKR